jgi:hypothetical protein
MERFFLAMSRAWDTFEMVEQTFLTSTSPLVVLTHVRARARATGRELDLQCARTTSTADTCLVPLSSASSGASR